LLLLDQIYGEGRSLVGDAASVLLRRDQVGDGLGDVVVPPPLGAGAGDVTVVVLGGPDDCDRVPNQFRSTPSTINRSVPNHKSPGFEFAGRSRPSLEATAAHIGNALVARDYAS